MAFIKAGKNEQVKTLGRMYLITREQFIEIVGQENALEPNEPSIRIDFRTTVAQGESLINANWYSRIIYLGEESAYPIFTFTGGWPDSDIEYNTPGEKYLQVIKKGIGETYNWPEDRISEYIDGLVDGG